MYTHHRVNGAYDDSIIWKLQQYCRGVKIIFDLWAQQFSSSTTTKDNFAVKYSRRQLFCFGSCIWSITWHSYLRYPNESVVLGFRLKVNDHSSLNRIIPLRVYCKLKNGNYIIKCVDDKVLNVFDTEFYIIETWLLPRNFICVYKLWPTPFQQCPHFGTA